MHSQLALTEHASLNLAPLILLDPVVFRDTLELKMGPATAASDGEQARAPGVLVIHEDASGGSVGPRRSAVAFQFNFHSK